MRKSLHVGDGWMPLLEEFLDSLPRGEVVVSVKEKLGGLRLGWAC